MKYYQTKLKPIQQIPKYKTLNTEYNLSNSTHRIIDKNFLITSVPTELIFSLNKQNQLTPYKETDKLIKKFGLTKTFDVPFFSV